MKKLTHTSVGEIAVYIWRVGLPWTEMSSKTDYKALSVIPSSRPEWTNALKNIPFMRLDDNINKAQYSDLEYKKILGRKPRRKDLLQNIIVKGTKSEDLVLVACCGTIDTDRAFQMSPHH